MDLKGKTRAGIRHGKERYRSLQITCWRTCGKQFRFSMTEMTKTDPAAVKSQLREGTKAEILSETLPEEEIGSIWSLVVLSPGVPTDLPLVLHFKR